MTHLPHRHNGADAIRELVCGFPSHKRKRRLLLVLQAYIDGSGNPEHSGALVLAGYVSSVGQWELFSDEWQRVLEMPLRLRYFKMNEAYRLKGEFYAWSEQRRKERLQLFYGVIEEHVEFFLSCIVPFKDFNAALDAMPVNFRFHPYHLAFTAIMGRLRERQEELGLKERVDFIFDDEVMEKTTLLENWDYVISATPENEQAFVGRTPIFRDDEEVLPLQAADLLAWQHRNQWEAANEALQAYEPPWRENREIPGIMVIYDEASIRRILEPALAKTIAQYGPLPIK